MVVNFHNYSAESVKTTQIEGSGGARLINRFRLAVALLYVPGAYLSFPSSAAGQSFIFFLAVGLMMTYGIALEIACRRVTVPAFVAKAFLSIDVILLSAVVLTGVVDVDRAVQILRGTTLYLLYMIYIACAALLHSRAFVLWIGLLAAVGSVSVAVAAAAHGVAFSVDAVLVQHGLAESLTAEIFKAALLIAAALIVRSVIGPLIELQARSAAGERFVRSSLESLEVSRRSMESAAGNLESQAGSLNQFVQGFNDSIADHATSFEEISAAMEEMSSGARYAAESVSEQRKRIDHLNEESLRLGSLNAGLEDRSVELDDTVNDTRQLGEMVTTSVRELDDTLQAMVESFERVSAVTEMMAEVADRTNLLALNASIEAARAGEAGRGFAVVATEVSRLADSSAENARNIEEIVRESSERSKAGRDASMMAVRMVDKQEANFEKIFQRFEDLTKMVQDQGRIQRAFLDDLDGLRGLAADIERTTLEQSAGSEEVIRSLSGMELFLSNLVDRSDDLRDSIAKIDEEARALRRLAADGQGEAA